MSSEVNPFDPEFLPVRRALERVYGNTAAYVADMLIKLRATQFQRFVNAVEEAAELPTVEAQLERERLLVRITMAENLAEDALSLAHQALAAAKPAAMEALAEDALDTAHEAETQAAAAKADLTPPAEDHARDNAPNEQEPGVDAPG